MGDNFIIYQNRLKKKKKFRFIAKYQMFSYKLVIVILYIYI